MSSHAELDPFFDSFLAKMLETVHLFSEKLFLLRRRRRWRGVHTGVGIRSHVYASRTRESCGRHLQLTWTWRVVWIPSRGLVGFPTFGWGPTRTLARLVFGRFFGLFFCCIFCMLLCTLCLAIFMGFAICNGRWACAKLLAFMSGPTPPTMFAAPSFFLRHDCSNEERVPGRQSVPVVRSKPSDLAV